MGGAGTSDNRDMEVPACAGCRERDAIIAELMARIAVLEQRLAEQDQRLVELEAGVSGPNRKAGRFCRKVVAVYPALWTLVRVEGVEPTNTQAERLPAGRRGRCGRR